jgi:putative restriction endonuclease
MAKSAAVKWTREHYLIALNLYCKLPFGKFDKSNGVIIDVAGRMGRTPSSLAMKLSNFASLDPVQRARGIRGLSGASQLDRQRWDDFQNQVNVFGPESEQVLHDLYTSDDSREVDFLSADGVQLESSDDLARPQGLTDRIATVTVRRGQQFFRQSILNAYGIRCCISGIEIPQLLIASHIAPWCDFPEERLNPKNGLCLSAIHDAAFDAGLITLDEGYRVVVSKKIKRFYPHETLEQNFGSFEGKAIRLPEKLAEPDGELMAHHRDRIFVG